MFMRTEFLSNPEVKYSNGANVETARTIIRKIGNDIAYREKEILLNLAEVEQNTEVPEGYVQYYFYSKTGEGFQAGKYTNGSFGISN
jgi:predicted AlkP superfamily phosphohydrolase/phosphomutase